MIISISNLLNRYFKENNLNWGILVGRDGIDCLKHVIDDNDNDGLIKIIITDENMNYMQGSSATSILRKLEEIQKIKHLFIISLTAFMDQENHDYILSNGADIVCVKPLSYIKLKEILVNK